MKVDPNFIALVSLDESWSVQERKTYGLLTSQAAQDLLAHWSQQNHGDSLVRWSFYYLLHEKKLIGFKVLLGRLTGANLRYLQKITSFFENTAPSKKQISPEH